jgi:hypothetical protein
MVLLAGEAAHPEVIAEQQMIERVLDIWETPGGSGAREILPSLPVAVAGMRPAKDAA